MIPDLCTRENKGGGVRGATGSLVRQHWTFTTFIYIYCCFFLGEKVHLAESLQGRNCSKVDNTALIVIITVSVRYLFSVEDPDLNTWVPNPGGDYPASAYEKKKNRIRP